MKGDYSEPGLMPGRPLKQIDLPSPYLVYALWKSSPAEATTFACGASFRIFVPNRTQLSKIEQKLRFLLKIRRNLARAMPHSKLPEKPEKMTGFKDGGRRAHGGT
jgi:hypothetical protein